MQIIGGADIGFRVVLARQPGVGAQAVRVQHSPYRASDRPLVRSLRYADSQSSRTVLRPLNIRAFDAGDAQEVVLK